MIYTSYFAKLKSLPEHIIPVSICGKAPDWYKGLQYKKLAPKYDFFMEWKKNHNNDYYIKCFNEQVLGKLNWFQVYEELQNLAASCGKQQYEICLICYEKPSDFCHRHLVSNWFNKNLVACREQAIDYIVKELNLLPYQEYIVRRMWESKNYLTPVRHSGWSYTRGLLTVADTILRKDG